MTKSEEHAGTWWNDWLPRLVLRSGKTKVARKRMGSLEHPAGTPAPGNYVSQTT